MFVVVNAPLDALAISSRIMFLSVADRCPYSFLSLRVGPERLELGVFLDDMPVMPTAVDISGHHLWDSEP